MPRYVGDQPLLDKRHTNGHRDRTHDSPFDGEEPSLRLRLALTVPAESHAPGVL